MNRKMLQCSGIKLCTDRVVTENRPDIIIKKRGNMHSDKSGVGGGGSGGGGSGGGSGGGGSGGGSSVIIVIIIIIIIDEQNKYQEQAHEICAMWKQNAVQMILIVISSTGVIPKSLSQRSKTT
jgi:hypothetical protein